MYFNFRRLNTISRIGMIKKRFSCFLCEIICTIHLTRNDFCGIIDEIVNKLFKELINSSYLKISLIRRIQLALPILVRQKEFRRALFCPLKTFNALLKKLSNFFLRSILSCDMSLEEKTQKPIKFHNKPQYYVRR